MPRMCQYGNCTKDVVMSNGNGVSVNYHGNEKPVFCCGTHAALWLLRNDGNYDAFMALYELMESQLHSSLTKGEEYNAK